MTGRDHPRFLGAGNAGAFTLDGTRTYRVGRGRAVLIDPGPAGEDHVHALVAWMADAHDVTVLLNFIYEWENWNASRSLGLTDEIIASHPS